MGSEMCIRDRFTYEKYLSQLELPGDIWNNRFKERILVNSLKERIKGIKSNSRIGARKIYLYLAREYMDEKVRDILFPVYLDASFFIRNESLDKLIENASQIKTAITTECGEVRSKKEILKAFSIMRHMLMK